MEETGLKARSSDSQSGSFSLICCRQNILSSVELKFLSLELPLGVGSPLWSHRK